MSDVTSYGPVISYEVRIEVEEPTFNYTICVTHSSWPMLIEALRTIFPSVLPPGFVPPHPFSPDSWAPDRY
ncbi:hypothetical protein QCA50_021203 [Cerrena zonata]|uniref:Uncharacterized protein n=1 Tax=Cerrena zonata TaxID=2478898 RepID=A0AAW0FF59_9APHY